MVDLKIQLDPANDPALSVARVRRMTDVVIPLDDNVLPELYVPLAAHLTAAIVGR